MNLNYLSCALSCFTCGGLAYQNHRTLAVIAGLGAFFTLTVAIQGTIITRQAKRLENWRNTRRTLY